MNYDSHSGHHKSCYVDIPNYFSKYSTCVTSGSFPKKVEGTANTCCRDSATVISSVLGQEFIEIYLI